MKVVLAVRDRSVSASPTGEKRDAILQHGGPCDTSFVVNIIERRAAPSDACNNDTRGPRSVWD